jgi:hypothetical protein
MLKTLLWRLSEQSLPCDNHVFHTTTSNLLVVAEIVCTILYSHTFVLVIFNLGRLLFEISLELLVWRSRYLLIRYCSIIVLLNGFLGLLGWLCLFLARCFFSSAGFPTRPPAALFGAAPLVNFS